MAKHYCNKEEELLRIEQALVESKLLDQKIRDDVAYIKKALAGNGEIGIIKKVESHEKFVNEYNGKSQVYKFWLGSGWFITIALFTLSIILNYAR